VVLVYRVKKPETNITCSDASKEDTINAKKDKVQEEESKVKKLIESRPKYRVKKGEEEKI